MESQSAAVLSGVTFRPVPAARGLLTADQVAAALRPDPDDITVVDLVTIENSHQVGGGSVQPVDEVRAIAKACDAAAVPLYVDGSGIGRAAAEWVDRLAAEGVRVTIVAGKVRMLTHRDVAAADIPSVLTAWRRAAAGV